MSMPFSHKVDAVFQKELDRIFAVYDAHIAYLDNRIAQLERQPHETGTDWTPANLALYYPLAAALTLSAGDMNRVHVINCTIASNVTLPTAVEGNWVTIENAGAAAITIKNTAATTIGTLLQYQRTTIPVLANASQVPAWPLGIVSYGTSSEIYVTGDINIRATVS